MAGHPNGPPTPEPAETIPQPPENQHTSIRNASDEPERSEPTRNGMPLASLRGPGGRRGAGGGRGEPVEVEGSDGSLEGPVEARGGGRQSVESTEETAERVQGPMEA
ncbi:hypothetical protein GCM10010404_47280 [Nonomuraea africana]